MILDSKRKESDPQGIFKLKHTRCNMHIKRVLIAIFFLQVAGVFSQNGQLKRGDEHFDNLAYHLAIKEYLGVLDTKLITPEIRAKLALCYYNINDLTNAEKYFKEAVFNDNISNEYYFYYAQTLKQLGNYEASNTWMNTFYQKANLDHRALSYIQNPSYLQTIEKEGVHFSISHVGFNTADCDFGGYACVKNQQLYFISSRRNSLIKYEWAWNGRKFLDLYSTSATSSENPTLISEINTTYHEGPLCFNLSENLVYFTRNNVSKGSARKDRNGIQNLKLYMAQVDQRGDWQNVQELAINSKEFSIGHPTISRDGKTLYFTSDMPGGFGGADLYRAPINADGTLGTPVNLGAYINTEGQEMFPWISADGLLFFSSNGHIGLGGLDVFVATMEENGTKFNHLTNVGRPLNSQNDDFAISFIEDGKVGYFSSNRAGGDGDDDIYRFELTRPFIFNVKLNGSVSDLATKDALPNAMVYLLNDQGVVIDSSRVDANGGYSFDLEPGKKYAISAKSTDYTSAKADIPVIPADQKEVVMNLALDKIPQIGLKGLITDVTTGMALEDVAVKIIDKTSGQVVFEGTTSESGQFLKDLESLKINDEIYYQIALSKSGYLSKTVDFNTKIVKPGIINVNDQLDVSLGRVEVGIDLATLIDIKPIYFDLGKYAIRKDAALELDKIVKVMNDYPMMEIELGSHTDCRSSIAFNLKLSDNRAKASAEYIKKRITNPQRIYGKGYGESKLKVDCPCEGTVKSSCSEEEHQQNRRTEFIIIKM